MTAPTIPTIVDRTRIVLPAALVEAEYTPGKVTVNLDEIAEATKPG